MKKIILIGCFILCTFSQAKMVNGIALIVNGEAVTTAEIRAVQKQMNVNKKQATDMLIADRLQKSAMKDVSIPETDIDSKVSQIAAQNNLTIQKMQKVLKEQGTSWSKYRKSIKERMKKEKFYRDKVSATLSKPSEDELKIFYDKNKKLFVAPVSISMVEYSSASESSMKKFLETKKKKGVKSRSVKKLTKDLNPSLLSTILRTQNGSFTRPINNGNKFISYKVISKNGQRAMSFEDSKNAVAGKWKQKQQGKALKNYFEKLKTNADIQVIR
ncbi:MAG: peptidyl-prolyl cis-trans isomerase [Bacteroidales bacterium]|nr:peptidyl-prolyl cis-trans isomerase [Bacteroidales bacterium]